MTAVSTAGRLYLQLVGCFYRFVYYLYRRSAVSTAGQLFLQLAGCFYSWPAVSTAGRLFLPLVCCFSVAVFIVCLLVQLVCCFYKLTLFPQLSAVVQLVGYFYSLLAVSTAGHLYLQLFGCFYRFVSCIYSWSSVSRAGRLFLQLVGCFSGWLAVSTAGQLFS